MMPTTIKLQASTKHRLEQLRQKKETYDEIINRLLASAQKQDVREGLIAAGKDAETARIDLESCNEWETPWPE